MEMWSLSLCLEALDHAPPNSSNQSGARLRTPALCQRPQQQGMCAPSPPAAKGRWRIRRDKAGKLMLLVAPDRERWPESDSPLMPIGLSSDCRPTAAVREKLSLQKGSTKLINSTLSVPSILVLWAGI